MQHLNSALQHFQTNLNDHWSDPLQTIIQPTANEETNGETVEIWLLTLLVPIIDVVFGELNESVLAGEYVEDLESTRIVLTQIEDHLKLQANFDIPHQPTLTARSQDIFTSSFLKPIRIGIRYYRLLLDSVERKLNYEPEVDTIFHALKKENEHISHSNVQQQLSVFKTNTQISKIDHSLSFDNDMFRDLLLSLEELKNLGSSGTIIDVLKKKCEYLIYKLSCRLGTEKIIKYGLNFQYQTLTTNQVDDFQKYNEVIKAHYQDGVKGMLYKQRQDSALKEFDKVNPRLNLDEIHALIKYFKDVKVNLEKLNKLRNLFIEDFKISVNQGLSDFDKKSYELMYCYLENNVLSLELDKNRFRIDNWESKFLPYIEHADDFKNSNFFPYFKIIDKFLSPQIQNLFEQSDSTNDDIDKRLALLKKLIEKYDDNFKSLVKKLKICQQTNYLTTQLNYLGCVVEIVDVNGKTWKCFVATSYVLPLDYSYWIETVEKYKQELYKFNTMLDIQLLTVKDKKSLADVKSEMLKTDKRHIEILSIFSALVLFVSNEIQIFSNISNITDAVAYTLLFAYSIGLFVVLIWFVTRPDGLKWKPFPYVHLTIFCLFLAGFGYGVYYIERNNPRNLPENKILEKQKYQIDSSKNQFRKDSIKRAGILMKKDTISNGK